jgi:predicted DNA binding CopG/RHH family protein
MTKPIPEFSTEDEERAFWHSNDSSEYLDWKNSQHVQFSNLKSSTRVISLRLPEPLLNALRRLAERRDESYQSLIRQFLYERVKQELKAHQVSKEE